MITKYLNIPVSAIVALTAISSMSSANAHPLNGDDKASNHGPATIHRDAVQEEIVIKAPPGTVWLGILEQRKHDTELKYCKELSNSEKQKLVEQKFIFPSILGDTECILHLSETPGERIDFRLHESEDLKKMEGSWILTPINNGQATKLSLSSYVVSNDPIPRIVTNSIIRGKTKRNLAMVKKFSEKSL